jgi:predicted acyltransferase
MPPSMSAPQPLQHPRFASVDALRGIAVAAMILVNTPGDWDHVYAPLLHSGWHGFTPTDLVFPLFLFIVGVSIALAPKGDAASILWRALRIVALGLALHLVAMWLIDGRGFRPWGVLQRIGICYGTAGLVALSMRPRAQWVLIAGLLLGYWALMAVGGSFERDGNLASRIDTALFGRFVYEYDAATGLGHDPEGLLSTLPAIATSLLGVRAGDWLRSGDARRLAIGGLAALVVGGAWSLVFPLNKNLWTSSFVLWTAGWSLLLLAAFHVAIDRRGLPAMGRRFGMNAIIVYAGAWVLECVLAATGLGGAIARAISAAIPDSKLASLGYALGFLLLWWLVAWTLDRRGIRLRI